jgi:hypothetical protein
MKISLIFLILISATSVLAQSQEKCFRNDGLKENHIIRFEADGGDIAGSYFVEPDGEPEQAQTFNFSGTRKGDALTVQFEDTFPPGVAPPKTKSTVWTLTRTAGGEVLRVMFYGKNYETNKYANYPADFVPCEPDFATLAKQAKRVAFARNANSAKFNLSFTGPAERKAFWLGARKNQTISVESIGCGISFFYPDKTAYEEGNAIDTLTTENIPQTGDYLLVISPAGRAGMCATTFKITN